MSYDSTGWNDDKAPPPIPKAQGRGCLGSTLMVVGGISLVMILGCCLIAGVAGYYFTPRILSVPAEVTQLASRIAPLKIPEGFEPDKGMEIDNPVVVTRVVEFKEAQGRGRMLIGQMKIKIAGADMNDQEQKSLADIFDKTANEFEQLKVTESEERIFSIAGEDVKFKFEAGEALASKTKFRQVTGRFKTAEGNAVLLFQVEEAAYNEEAITQLLQSLK